MLAPILRLVLKNKYMFIFLHRRVFFLQEIFPLNAKEQPFWFFFCYALKVLYMFGLYSFKQSKKHFIF